MRKTFLFLITFIAFLACRKTNSTTTDWFEIEIVNQKNIDCFNPEIIFLTREQEAYQILGNSLNNRYVALGLPKVLYPVGTKLYVSIHSPTSTEMTPCTLFGPTYAQVYIDDIK